MRYKREKKYKDPIPIIRDYKKKFLSVTSGKSPYFLT